MNAIKHRPTTVGYDNRLISCFEKTADADSCYAANNVEFNHTKQACGKNRILPVKGYDLLHFYVGKSTE